MFLDRQPDLDWTNPDLRRAMGDVLRFWLDRGVDGFRIDVIHALGKPKDLEDLPEKLAAVPICAVVDDPSVHPYVEFIRAVVDEYPDPPRVIVGETVLQSIHQIPPYYGTQERPELHLAFDFHPLHTAWRAEPWRKRIDETETVLAAGHGWPTWVLSNHDNPRHRTRYGSLARAEAAAVLLLSLRGTPFLYAGEELGLSDAEVPPDEQVDPGGRDGCRAPIPWDPRPGHGWAGGNRAWLPWPPEAEAAGDAASQESDPRSTLNLYRSLIAARRRSPALRNGEFSWVDSGPDSLAYVRVRGNDRRVIGINFSGHESWVILPEGRWQLEVSSRPTANGTGPAFGRFSLSGDQAVILEPAG
jgi:alpha-glucosidase